MLFYLVLFICIMQNVSLVPRKHKIEILSRPFNRNAIGFNNHKYKTNVDSPELSSESRRIFDWIKKILNKNTTNIANATTQRNSVQTQRIPAESTQRIPTYEDVLNERIRFRKIETNLTETLTKLSHVLTQILNIVKYTRYQDFHDLRAFIPSTLDSKISRREKRFKRDINGTGIKHMNSNVQDNNKDIGNTESNNIDNKHENNTNKVNKDVTIKLDITNGRRAMSPTRTNDEVKNRLFKYIDEAFADIAKKIDSLKETKRMFAKDISYRVGYIISNIDTLQVNMMNMKLDMDKNKFVWDDRKILNLYDTVKISNQATTDLLDVLKVYVDKSVN